MSLEGAIKDFGLSDIFQLIYVQQKSGVMSVLDGARRASVGFVKGMVVSAQMDNAEGIERIGEVLVRAKRISPPQLEKALKTQQDTGDYLGQILVSQNAVSEADLKKALRLQILETVYRLFRWKDGRYSFEQRDVQYPKQYIDPISTEHILMEGVRRLDEWPPIEKKIPSLKVIFAQVPEKRGEIEQAVQPETPVAAAVNEAEADPFADLGQDEPEGRFSANEIAVYHALNGSHDVSRLIELLQIGEFEVCKALANLLSAGLIVPLNAPAPSAVVAAERVPSELLRHAAVALGWIANLALLTSLIAVPTWALWGMRSAIVEGVHAEVRALRVMMLGHHIKGLGDLVDVWSVEHGRAPISVFDPLAEYGASMWPLKDPWGKPWSYDPISGKVTASGPTR
ncbi:MAG: DUF4388 domain-containing protein [Nitrospirota bacterium]